MRKKVAFWVDDDVYSKAEKIANKHGKSVHELAKQLLKAYLEGSREEGIPIKVEPKRFRAKKELKCATCGEKIAPGEWAYYVQYEYEDGKRSYEIHHASCWEYASDEALAKVFKEKRKLQRIIRALRKEANELADAIEEARAREKLMGVALEIEERVRKRIEEYYGKMKQVMDFILYSGVNSEETKKALDELSRMHEQFKAEIQELTDRLEEVSGAISIKIEKASKKPRR